MAGLAQENSGREAGMTETRPGGGPTVLRMILGRQLQALRENAGLNYEQAAEAVYSPSSTDPGEIDPFLALARDASKPGWWHSYDDVLPSWFRTFVGLEEAATVIRGYDPHWIPGLLQTPEYARASVQTGFPDAAKEEGGRRVELRLARQHILARPDPPRLWLVLDENTLRRPAATTGPEVMRAQIDKLIEAASRPNITVQVLPFTAGLHPAMYGPFRIFRFDAHDQPDIVYGETMTSAYYIDKPEETAVYIQT